MWKRATLKSYAKQELKFSYWVSFAVCLVAAALTGGAGGGGASNSSQSEAANIDPSTISPVVWSVILVAVVIGCLYTLFISLPVTVGQASFFVRAPQGDRRFSNLFSSFAKGRYMSSVKIMFIMYLKIFLWSLLLFIPGIIKSYQYRMVPYIISENPSLTSKQALDLSSQMTKGEKWKIFVLDLSFLGWILLGCVALFIGVFFVLPYIEATMAQLYFVLREKVMGPPMNGPSAPIEPIGPDIM